MSFRQKLHTDEIVYGLTLTLGMPQIAEMIARLGFDWIWIETEHTTMNLDTVQAQLQAIAGNGTAAVVRVDCND